MAPEPLMRRRLPLVRNWKEPPESTAVELPAVQTTGAPPEYTMAPRKEGGEVGGSTGTKRKEKVELVEDHDWLVLEA